MQVTNSTSPNFKSVTFTKRALAAMSQKMPSGKFFSVQEKMISKYKNSPLDIVVDTLSEECIRLCAKFKQKKRAAHVYMTKMYEEETIFTSIFKRSEKFFEKLCKTLDEQERLVLGIKQQ